MNYHDIEYMMLWVDQMSRFMGKRQLKTAIGAEISGFAFRVKDGKPIILSDEDNRTMKFKSIKLLFPKIDNKENI